MTFVPARSSPDAATAAWYAALLEADPAAADRASAAALELVRDVTRAPRERIAAALAAPEGAAVRAPYDEWFRYGLRLVRLGLYVPSGAAAG